MLHTYRALQPQDSDRGLYLYNGYHDASPRKIPYAAFPGLIAAAAAELRRAGVDDRSRVIFPFETSAESIFTFLALLSLGALPLSIRPASTGGAAGHLEFIAAVARRTRATHVLGLDADAAAGLDLRALDLAAVDLDRADEVDGAPALEHAADHLAFVQFSSGSTSFPKGVPITHGNLAHNLRLIVESDRRTLEDRGSSWLPLYHDMGLVGSLLTSIYAGTDAHVARPSDFLMGPTEWLQHLTRVRATMTVIPNFAIDYLLRYLDDDEALAGVDLSALRCIYLGSEPINIDNLTAFERRLAPFGLRAGVIKPCYGMAEAVLMVSTTALDGSYRVVPRPGGVKAISVGRVHPDFELRIRDEDGERCGDGEAGEIELRGGSLAGSYFEDERPFAGDDGFYPTGDVGFVDGGELFISGRAGDRFKINAQSYFSSDFEQLVEGLAFVRPMRSAVIQSEGRVVVLAEVKREALAAPAPHREAIAAAILGGLGVKVDPADVHFIRPGQLPRTSSGKLRRRAIADAHAAGSIRSAL